MPPGVGQTVVYRLSVIDMADIDKQRSAVAHYDGNVHRPGQPLPAQITFVTAAKDVVNLQVTLDGTDRLWVTGVPKGNGQGEWARS